MGRAIPFVEFTRTERNTIHIVIDMNDPTDIEIRDDAPAVKTRSSLWSVARRLKARRTPAPRSYIAGKTWFRDCVADELTCSQAEAERIVDRLEASGALRFRVDTRPGTDPRFGQWRVVPGGRTMQ